MDRCLWSSLTFPLYAWVGTFRLLQSYSLPLPVDVIWILLGGYNWMSSRNSTCLLSTWIISLSICLDLDSASKKGFGVGGGWGGASLKADLNSLEIASLRQRMVQTRCSIFIFIFLEVTITWGLILIGSKGSKHIGNILSILKRANT